jgi:glutamine amidotransferase
VRAVEKVGGLARLSNDPDEIATAERLLLPGVGAFASCANALRSSGLTEPVVAFAATGRPFLGICVGMQLLFDYSLEFGKHAGLGLLAGHVERIPANDSTGSRKVPHVGWSELLMPAQRKDWKGTVLEGVASGKAAAYFVHSYHCVPDDPNCLLAETDYAGFRITAAVARDNITGCQFHPEKSADIGLQMIERFLAA